MFYLAVEDLQSVALRSPKRGSCHVQQDAVAIHLKSPQRLIELMYSETTQKRRLWATIMLSYVDVVDALAPTL